MRADFLCAREGQSGGDTPNQMFPTVTSVTAPRGLILKNLFLKLLVFQKFKEFYLLFPPTV